MPLPVKFHILGSITLNSLKYFFAPLYMFILSRRNINGVSDGVKDLISVIFLSLNLSKKSFKTVACRVKFILLNKFINLKPTPIDVRRIEKNNLTSFRLVLFLKLTNSDSACAMLSSFRLHSSLASVGKRVLNMSNMRGQFSLNSDLIYNRLKT